jgi:hypothetical protein
LLVGHPGRSHAPFVPHGSRATRPMPRRGLETRERRRRWCSVPASPRGGHGARNIFSKNPLDSARKGRMLCACAARECAGIAGDEEMAPRSRFPRRPRIFTRSASSLSSWRLRGSGVCSRFFRDRVSADVLPAASMKLRCAAVVVENAVASPGGEAPLLRDCA